MLRHTANYLLAAQVAATADMPGPLVDVGCGTGLHSHWLAAALDRPLWLVDPDPKALAVARQRGSVERCFGSVAEIPARSAAVITAMEVVEHVDHADQPAFALELRRIAGSGAVVVVSTPDESSYRDGHSGYAPHVGTLDDASLPQLMTSAGLPGTTWRLSGGPFETSWLERALLPTANRLHGHLRQLIPGPVELTSVAVAALLRHLATPSDPGVDSVIARPIHTAIGTGLVAASIVVHNG